MMDRMKIVPAAWALLFACAGPCGCKSIRSALEVDADASQTPGIQFQDASTGIQPPPSQKPTYNSKLDRQAYGDKMKLNNLDAKFVEFWENLKLNGKAVETTLYHSGVYRVVDKSNPDSLTVKGTTMMRIDYKVVLHPMSSGPITVTFWKAGGGLYFYRRSGGCVAYRDELYGPFRHTRQFEFAGGAP